jgi:hypothetical protein
MSFHVRLLCHPPTQMFPSSVPPPKASTRIIVHPSRQLFCAPIGKISSTGSSSVPLEATHRRSVSFILVVSTLL